MRLFYFTSINLADCEPGAKSHVENILLGLHALKWDITLFSCDNENSAQPEFSFNHILVKKKNQSILEQLKEQIRLCLLLLTQRFEKPDIIYIRTSPLLFIPVLFSLFYKIPFFLEINAATKVSLSGKGFLKMAQMFENWTLKKAKAVITTTEELKSFFLKNALLDPDKIYVIPMGFESDLLKEPVLSSDFTKSKQDSFTIGFLGQFHTRQGIMDVINSVPLVAKEYNNICFFLAGKGLLEEKLKRQVADLNIDKYVKFAGFLDQKSVPLFLKECDLTIAPYFGKFNKKIPMGSPTKIFIYLASGKPVLTSDLPALRIFKPCKAVFFSKPDDPQNLARVIIDQIKKTPEQRLELGKAGRNFVKKHFTWEILSQKTSHLLMKAL